MSRLDDKFVTIEVEFKHAKPNAVLVAKDDEEVWLPRSLLSYRSDREMDRYTRGMIIDMKLFEWKARDLGWL